MRLSPVTRHPSLCSTNGFTLIELILIIIVLGILAVVVAGRVTTGNDLMAEREILAGHLRYVQTRALGDITGANWGLDFSANSYSIQRAGGGMVPNLPGETSVTHTLPAGITVTSTVDPITFDEWGSPGSATVTVTLSQGTGSQALTVLRNTGYIP